MLIVFFVILAIVGTWKFPFLLYKWITYCVGTLWILVCLEVFSGFFVASLPGGLEIHQFLSHQIIIFCSLFLLFLFQQVLLPALRAVPFWDSVKCLVEC